MNISGNTLILKIVTILAVIAVIILFCFCFVKREWVVFEKFDKDQKVWLVVSCRMITPFQQYETYLSVEHEKRGLVFSRSFINSYDMFDDCSDGKGAIGDLVLDDIAKSVKVIFQEKDPLNVPVFFAFTP